MQKHITRCIGFDPAYAKNITFAYHKLKPTKNNGWEEAGWEWGEFKHNNMHRLDIILQKAIESGINTVVCEDTYFGRNIKVTKNLSRICGRIEALALLNGMEFYQVATSSVAVLVGNGYTPRKRADIQTAAMKYARYMTGKDLNDDLSMAVSIADWGDLNLERE